MALKFFEWRKARSAEDVPQIQSNDEIGPTVVENKASAAPPRVKPPVKPRAVSRGDEDMNIDEIRELMLLLDQSNIADLELQKNDFKIALLWTSERNQFISNQGLAWPIDTTPFSYFFIPWRR